MSLCAVLLGIATLLVTSAPASAHTGFESSTPAQGEVVADPVSSIVIVFTGDTQPVDDLVVALDATGALRTPTGVTTEDQRSFTATFDPPLAGGEIGIRWAVLGADGHPLEGAFSFTVTAPIPTTSTTAPPTTQPTETAPASGTEPAATEPAETVSASTEPETVETVAVATTETAVVVADDGSSAGGDVGAAETSAAPSLDEFLAVETQVPGGGQRLVGRLLSIPAIAGAIGALAFLVGALRGRAREIAAVVSSVRVAGILIAVGALVEYSGSIAATGASFATGWTESPSRAMALRLVGAVVLVVGLRSATVAAGEPRTLSAAVIDSGVSPAPSSADTTETSARRWNPSKSALALAGAAVLVASFWFDGHTVTRGWRPLHAIVNSVHLVAGSIWFGGVISLCALLWWRHRRGDRLRAAELVVRFSSIATVALIGVAVAGAAMALMILDGFGELTGTEWGRTLLLKTAAVAFAAAIGAFNHFRLRPQLVASPGDPTVTATLRSVLIAEAIVLTFVVVVTCWLVAAAT